MQSHMILKRYCCFLLSLLLVLTFLACGKEKGQEEVVEEEVVLPEVESRGQPATEPTTAEAAPPVTPNQNYVQRPVKTSYVRAICLNVRADASSRAEVVGHVFKGDPLEVYETRGGWARITDAAGYVSGWVSTRYLSDTVVPSDFVIPDDYKEPKTPTVVEGISAQYIGSEACKNCHSRPHGPFRAGAYGVWRDHFHADAFVTLTRAYSRAIAKKRGIDDPTTDWRCLKCHVTAYGVAAERRAPTYRDEEGVGCEACHGPASEYLIPHTRPNVDDAALAAMGFRVYDDLQARDRMCRACHNELSPTYKPFNVEAFSEAIRHWTSEFVLTVKNPEAPPVVTVARVEQPQAQPPSEQKLAQELAPPPAAPKPAPPPEPKPQTKASTPPKPKPQTRPPLGDARLAGIASDWMLDKNGPKRGPVLFTHLAHIKSYVAKEQEAEVCQVCHHTNKVGAKPGNCSTGPCHKFEPTAVPSREKAFHGSCRTCHRAEGSGPQKCSECHNTRT